MVHGEDRGHGGDGSWQGWRRHGNVDVDSGSHDVLRVRSKATVSGDDLCVLEMCYVTVVSVTCVKMNPWGRRSSSDRSNDGYTTVVGATQLNATQCHAKVASSAHACEDGVRRWVSFFVVFVGSRGGMQRAERGAILE